MNHQHDEGCPRICRIAVIERVLNHPSNVPSQIMRHSAISAINLSVSFLAADGGITCSCRKRNNIMLPSQASQCMVQTSVISLARGMSYVWPVCGVRDNFRSQQRAFPGDVSRHLRLHVDCHLISGLMHWGPISANQINVRSGC